MQRIIQPTTLSVAISLYGGGGPCWLVCSAEAPAACLYVSHSPPPASIEATSFCSLLRKHLTGARLTAVTQPGWDRIAVLAFAGRDELGDVFACDFVVELMGKHSNLILVRPDGRIAGAVKHVGRSRSRVRQVLPGRAYMPPPGQDKLPPDRVSGAGLAEALALTSGETDEPPAASSVRAGELVHVVAGVDSARAAAALASARDATGGTPLTWEAIAGSLRSIAASAAVRESGAGECVRAEQAFASFLAGPGNAGGLALKEQGTVPGSGPLLVLRHSGRLAAALAAEAELLRGRVQDIGERLASIPDPEEDLRRGNTLLTHLGELRGRRKEALRDGLDEVEVDLPAFTATVKAAEDPVTAAQGYFERYAAGRKAREALGGLLATAQERLQYVEQLAFQLEDDPPRTLDDLARVIEDALQAGIRLPRGAGPTAPPRRQSRRGAALPLRLASPGGLEVLVGRNNRENDRLLRSGTPGDFWFHARGVPGAHVLLRTAGRRDVPREDLLFAAGVAAGRSRAAGSALVPVDMVPLRQVRREKGAAPGFVRYSGETTVNVAPRREETGDTPGPSP